MRAFVPFLAYVICSIFLVYRPVSAQDFAEKIHLADSLSQEDKIDSAIIIANDVLKTTEKQFGKTDTTVATVLDILGTCYRLQADYEKAEHYYGQALEIREKSLRPYHPDIANSLHNLGILRFNQSRYSEADSLHHRALKIREDYFGPDHPEVARSLNALGVLYWAQGQYNEAESMYKRSLEIWKNSLGSDHRRVADCLNNLGSLYWQQGRYVNAELQYKLSLNILTKTLGPNHPHIAKGLNNLAILYRQQGRYAEAEPLYKRALEIWTAVLGPEHPNVADCLNNLGVLYYEQGRYSEAEPLFLQSLHIQEESHGEDHPGVADCLINLGVLYYEEGRYQEAEPLYKRALTITEKTYGENHPRVADCLVNLGVLYGEQGLFNKVEPLYKRALQIQESIVGPEHPDVAGCLINLGYVYCDQGRYTDAEPLFKRALDIQEKTLGKDHPDVADCLNCLGNLYYEQGRYTEAEPLYNRALEIQEKTLGPEHASVAYCLNSLGRLYCKQKRFSEAEPIYQRAVDIQKKALGANHPHVAIFLYCQADLYRMQGRYKKAEPMFKQALHILENAMGPDHPEVAACLTGLARLYRDMGRWSDARNVGRKVYDIRRKNFQDGFEVLSEKNALLYSKFMKDAAAIFLSIPCGPANDCQRYAQDIADVVFSAKNIVSDGILARNIKFAAAPDSTLRSLADSLRLARFRLAKLYVQGSSEEYYENYRNELAIASAEKQRLESKLARRNAGFNWELEFWNVDVQKVIESLPEGSVLVEYQKFDYNLIGDDLESRYLAVIINSKGEVSLQRLGLAASIDSSILLYQLQFQNPEKLELTDYKTLANRIYHKIIKPIEDALQDASTVFIAPDGDLNLVSFAGLTDDDGKYLIEKYPIHYLSSGRDLLRLKTDGSYGIGLLAMGDPNYDAPASLRLSLANHTTSKSGFVSLLNAFTNFFSGCRKPYSNSISSLPGARREIELITEQWKQVSEEPAIKYLGSEASEENLKSQCAGKRVIHLATHAYYAASITTAEHRIIDVSPTETFAVENPLLRSGLYLAGSNLQGAGSELEGAEDGILTAEEVAGMNLEGTDLVVLSACRTGIGEVMSGEGVYGLRRAFQMAGARTVISALWRVSDSATADLMGKLYHPDQNNLALIMQSIATKRIHQLRSEGKSDHPFYWGGFVTIGDWRIH